MRTQISRDPFARSTLYRTRHYVTASTCAWCGQVKLTKSGARYLYAYDTESDGRDSWAGIKTRTMLSRFFCSIGCMRSYHE